jgi:hypothetical protein
MNFLIYVGESPRIIRAACNPSDPRTQTLLDYLQTKFLKYELIEYSDVTIVLIENSKSPDLMFYKMIGDTVV